MITMKKIENFKKQKLSKEIIEAEKRDRIKYGPAFHFHFGGCFIDYSNGNWFIEYSGIRRKVGPGISNELVGFLS